MPLYDNDPSGEQRRIWSEEQLELRKKHELNDRLSFDISLKGLKYIGGADLSFPLNDHENAVACLIVMTMPDLQVVYKRFLETKLYLPYISGFLAFREVNPLLTLLDQLKSEQPDLYPQILLIDGNGLLHPRQFGIACHLGVLSDTPTIGVAKNFLMIPDELESITEMKNKWHATLQTKGDRLDLVGKKNDVLYGTALRTSSKNPLLISQGHRVSLDLAVQVVLATCPKYRIPEPIRMADLESRAYIRNKKHIQSSKTID
ncbi:hypothetical protein G6F64_010569 [Rhizopus arrhizus]|uniref:Endonuclease V n=1 Tax=Rhizopus oryzae TaxID=64495 RepID=A0A9P6X0T6_RHIOR|nr:hypothetical protein G6F64_010569 [Rhizopus arrhizus]